MQKFIFSYALATASALTLCFSSTLANAAAPKKTQPLPAPIVRAMKASPLTTKNLVVSVVPVDGGRLKLAWQANKRIKPASTEKVITTLAALETLGPNWRWKTRYFADGTIEDGELDGNLVIKGGGDPVYVVEKLWRDLRRLKKMGITEITGDILIDRTLFDVKTNSIQFDHELQRPYTKEADAALLNFQSVTFAIEPDKEAKVARLTVSPELSDFEAPETIPLGATPKTCTQWRQAMQLDPTNATRPVFNGTFPEACPAKELSYIFNDANEYWARVIRPLAKEVGIDFDGKVKSARVPETALLLFEAMSDDLVTVTRLTNKYSNNVLARHIFLTTGLVAADATQAATYAMAQKAINTWLTEKVHVKKGSTFIENGSGLSHDSFVTARAMTDVLRYGWKSPRAVEWVSSFPVTGLDGTMRKRNVAPAHGFIKTGLLNDVKSIAGIVQAKSGKRYAVFASVQGKGATATDAPLDAVIDWIYTKG